MQEKQSKLSTDFLTQFLVRWIIATVAASFAMRVVLNGFLSPEISDAQLVIVCAALSVLLAVAVFARMEARRESERYNQANLQLAMALAKLDALGDHDPLTGVLNRRALIETLEWELLRAKRTGHPFCFAVIDIDHFRSVNEAFGTTAGDMVLKTLADASIKLLRALDRFGRVGGEEFGIVLPATWLDQGMIAMDRLTKAVEACDWEHIAPDFKMTFSAGLTTNAVNDTAETIMRRADDAMLKAKSEGRNRTVAAEEALPDMPPIDVDMD